MRSVSDIVVGAVWTIWLGALVSVLAWIVVQAAVSAIF